MSESAFIPLPPQQASREGNAATRPWLRGDLPARGAGFLGQSGLPDAEAYPGPMNFLDKILGRAGNKPPFLLLSARHTADDTMRPGISRLLEQFVTLI